MGVISVCVNGAAQEVAAFGKSHKLALPLEAAGSRIAAMYGVDSVPTSILMDQNGRILARWRGYRRGQLRDVLKAAGVDIRDFAE